MQLFANIVFAASGIFLTAISFSLIFSVTRFFHFAHAAMITYAAYIGFALTVWIGLPLPFSLPIAVISAGVLGWTVDRAVYRPMRDKDATSLILLLASLGLYIMLQNGISVMFGDDTKMLAGWAVVPGFDILGAKVTCIQIATICSAGTVLAVMMILLSNTKIGLSLRAVASDCELAEVSGIDYDGALGWAFFFGSCLAGLSGLLTALDVGMNPTMGLAMLLMGVVATIVGGVGGVSGIAIASLFLAVCQHVAAWKLGFHWQDTMAFLVLIVFLLCKPEGVAGKRIRKAMV